MLKKKYAAIFLSLALTASDLAGCSVSSADGAGAESGSMEGAAFLESVVYGEVSAVGSNTLTIRLGTIENSDETGEETAGEDGALESAEEMSAQSREDSAEREKPQELPEGGLMGVRLVLTGQEVTIQLKNETVIKRVSFGKGEARSDGEVPERPEDGAGEADDGAASDSVSGQEAENGEAAADGVQAQGSSDGEVLDMGMGMNAITLSDIAEGDIVSVAFDEDVYAQTITVLNSENE